jgi:hypothetical protein
MPQTLFERMAAQAGRRAYGAREGLEESLERWVERLSTDKSLPWMGLGLIADLKAAVAALRDEEDEFANFQKPEKSQEYDL